MLTALLLICIAASSSIVYADDNGQAPVLKRLRFIAKKFPILYPSAPDSQHDHLIAPPGENVYFTVRPDGQPYVLNVDSTVNLTSALNEFYFDPKWRGEDWCPFDQVDTIERACRLMSTWKDYDEMNQFHLLNGVSKWFEKWSGFGP